MAEETLNVREPDPKWSRQERNAFLDFRDHHQLHSVIKEDGSALSVQFDNREIIATRRDDGGIDFWADSHKPQNGEYSETNNDRITDLDDNQGLKLWCSHYFSTHEKLALKEADARVSWTKVKQAEAAPKTGEKSEPKADPEAQKKAAINKALHELQAVPYGKPGNGAWLKYLEAAWGPESTIRDMVAHRAGNGNFYQDLHSFRDAISTNFYKPSAHELQFLEFLGKTWNDPDIEKVVDNLRQQQATQEHEPKAADPKSAPEPESKNVQQPSKTEPQKAPQPEPKADPEAQKKAAINKALHELQAVPYGKPGNGAWLKYLEAAWGPESTIRDMVAHRAGNGNFYQDLHSFRDAISTNFYKPSAHELQFLEFLGKTWNDPDIEKVVDNLRQQQATQEHEPKAADPKSAPEPESKNVQQPSKTEPQKAPQPEPKADPEAQKKAAINKALHELQAVPYGKPGNGAWLKYLEAAWGPESTIRDMVAHRAGNGNFYQDLHSFRDAISTNFYKPSAHELQFLEFLGKTWNDPDIEKVVDNLRQQQATQEHEPKAADPKSAPEPESKNVQQPSKTEPQKAPQPEPKADPEAQKKAAINKALHELQAVPYGKPGNGAWLKYLEAAWGPESTIRDMVAHRAGNGNFYQDLHQFRDAISTNFYKPSAHELQFLEFLGKTWNNPDIEKVVDNLRQQQATQEHEPKAADPKSAPEPESKNVQQPSKTEPQKAEPAAPEHTQTEAKSEKFLLNPITGKKVALPDRALNSPDPDVLSRINDGKLFRAQDLAVAITYARLKANNRNLDEGTFKRTISDAGYAVNEALAKEAIAIPCAVKNGKEGTDYYFSTKDLDLRQLQTGKYKLNSKALQYLESMMNGAENTNALTLEQKSIQNDMRKYLNERNVAGEDAKSRMMSFYEYGSKAINTVLTNGADEVIKKNRFTVNENGQLMHLDEARRLEQQKTQQAQQHQQGARV